MTIMMPKGAFDIADVETEALFSIKVIVKYQKSGAETHIFFLYLDLIVVLRYNKEQILIQISANLPLLFRRLIGTGFIVSTVFSTERRLHYTLHSRITETVGTP